MRMHFYDLLTNSVINPKEELQKLCTLFSGERHYWSGAFKGISLEEYIDRVIFRNLSFRGSYIGIEGMRRSLGISEDDFSFNSHCVSVPLEKLFLFCEFLLALGSEGESKLKEVPEFYTQMLTIVENISHLLDKTNHCLENISETDTARCIIVPKNKLTTQAVELIAEKPVALSAIEYNHFSLRGDLSRKRAVLTTLANYVEPILHSGILKNNGYAQLETDTGFILNNFHIRHNNKEGTKRREYTAALSDGALEKWYDRAYTMMLMVIVAQDNAAVHAEIKELKQSYNW